MLKDQGKKQVMQADAPDAQNSNVPAEPLVATRPVPSQTEVKEALGRAKSLVKAENALADMLIELKALRSFVADD